MRNKTLLNLGIPVDGSKSEMIQKLKTKGYTSSQHNKGILVGEFNGMNVNIHVVTNNNKVYRIMACDVNSIDKGEIKIRFNRLCEQFKKNSKYLSALLVKYTEEQLANPTEEIKKDIYETSTSFVVDMMLKKPVWFRIEEFAGKYYIAMYYDNEYNMANGEDL